ncbi:hypothetical protein HAX54_025089 [Datura stramonium]|uniref:Uncharacterized protein n=1 Tax=Datura stramonium TaxID=4076 RepID=A0ABS8V117_DATST|nr:hypothetical protein [Datura stramonium]
MKTKMMEVNSNCWLNFHPHHHHEGGALDLKMECKTVQLVVCGSSRFYNLGPNQNLCGRPNLGIKAGPRCDPNKICSGNLVVNSSLIRLTALTLLANMSSNGSNSSVFNGNCSVNQTDLLSDSSHTPLLLRTRWCYRYRAALRRFRYNVDTFSRNGNKLSFLSSETAVTSLSVTFSSGGSGGGDTKTWILRRGSHLRNPLLVLSPCGQNLFAFSSGDFPRSEAENNIIHIINPGFPFTDVLRFVLGLLQFVRPTSVDFVTSIPGR